jgi:hypothetical protein
MNDFDYISKKIEEAEFVHTPFKHIYIPDVFNDEHFNEIVRSKEINLNDFTTTEELIEKLKETGYKAITFPGTTTNEKEYLKWYKSKDRKTHGNANTCEGVGITYRLKKIENDFLNQVNDFFQSSSMHNLLCRKFELSSPDQRIEGGIQKYLDGYEISPHPDIRKKSLTWMINVNPMMNAEHLSINTQYMRFKKEFEYIIPYWKYNSNVERCWVPWEWTEIVTTQSKNNSMVIFAPDCDTLHAVKLDYNHLNGQRTQIYGNLWAKEVEESASSWWDDLVIRPKSNLTLYRKLSDATPNSLKNLLKKIIPR